MPAFLVLVFRLEFVEGLGGAQERNASTRNDAFFDGRRVAWKASSTRSLRSFTSTSLSRRL